MKAARIAALESIAPIACALALAWLGAAPVEAQTFTRRRVPEGEVTGLEMSIDGSLRAMPGGEVRWFVSLYEVLRRRDLRPSPGSTLTVTASFARQEAVTTVVTDASGRASLVMPIPADLEGAPHIRVEAVSPRRVRRVFSVDLELVARHEIELFVDRATVPPGATVAVFGRAIDRLDGRPVTGLEIELRGSVGGRPVSAPLTRSTDASGVFSGELPMPTQTGEARIEARAEHASATTSVTLASRELPSLWVEAVPTPRVAAPGTPVAVDLVVRTPRGAPIADAQVDWTDAVHEPGDSIPQTDAAGRARLVWSLPSIADARIADQTRTVQVVSAAHGSLSVPVSVRVARVAAFTSLAVEGGALVPGLDGRVYVRAVGPDGLALAGRELSLDVPRLGGVLTARTDADGVAVFEGRVLEAVALDGCGGPTATVASLTLDRHRERHCLPVDPDATVVVRAEARSSEGALAVRVARRGSVERAPVELLASVRDGASWTPIARSLVAPGESSASLDLPARARGEVWLRARPILDAGRAARGGGLVVWRGEAGSRLMFDADGDAARVEAPNATVAVFAMDGSQGAALRAALRGRLSPVGGAIDDGRSPAFVAALLAARTPSDVAASVTLREGEIVAQPLPENPVIFGLLRDPWRTRARFVRGRIGRMMRAVEDYVDAHIPDGLEEVAVREARGWRFNGAVLDAALTEAGLGDEMAAALDGEPLDIDALSALDASFTYDRVARRITRERLWRVYAFLRQLVRARELDRPWARRGDPSQLVVALVDLDLGVYYEGEQPMREHLFDGWGNPFVLRPVRGRARFDFLEPVPGWELVSAGPDGRLGTADDVFDPFARVLPSGGLYSEAVSEDVLLARLSSVALGRATVESLAEVFSVDTSIEIADGGAEPTATWEAVPAPPAEQTSSAPLAPVAQTIGGVGEARTWRLPNERRAYEAIAIRFGRDGSLASARAEFVAGAAWTAFVELPEALRPGDALRVPLTLARLADGPEPEVEVSVEGRAIGASLEGRHVRIEARAPGLAVLRVRVRSGTYVIGTFERRVRVVPLGSLHARHVGAMVHGHGELVTSLPTGARAWRGRLVVGAPRSLPDDPIFESVLEAHPAFGAWVAALSGAELDPELAARVRAMAGPAGDGLGDVDTACALVAWTAADDREAPTAAATRHFASSMSSELSVRASSLAALASAAPGVPGGTDPLASAIATLRQDGWRALATASDRPAVMARVAAALLLSDREDAPGRALLERVRGSLVTDAHGRLWVPGDPERPGDAWVGTLALAIAARQVGLDALADSLASSAVARVYLVPRVEAADAFWAVAASVYGAFGVEGPEQVEVVIDSEPRTLSLRDGVASVPLSPGSRVSLASEGAVWARTETRFLVPFEDREVGALRARIEGTAGAVGERAGFELLVENVSSEAVAIPVLEVSLPGAARFGDETRSAMARVSDVRSVSEPDGAGVVRIVLSPLAATSTVRIPLPLRWIASGRSRGLALSAYDAARPGEIATHVDRELVIEEVR